MSSNQTHKSRRQKGLKGKVTGCRLLGKRSLDLDATVVISKKTTVQKSIEKQMNFVSKEIKNKLQVTTTPISDGTSIGDTNKFECPRCCYVFKTLLDLMQHYCDRIYVDMESCVVKLNNLPLAAKTSNIKAKTTSNASAKTGIEHSHTRGWCRKCGHEFETFAKYAEHPCEKILANMKSCFVKLDKLYHTSEMLKNKLQVGVKANSNDMALAETEVNNTCETCPVCCSEFKTFAELENHSCDRLLTYMKSCVVKLDNLPLVSPKTHNLQATQKSNSGSIAGSEINSNCKRCPRCGNKYKAFVEYIRHPCEEILAGMQSCVVQLGERLGIDVHTGDALTFFECNHCKKSFLGEYFVKHHILHSAAKCKQKFKRLLLNINNTSLPTTATKINIVDDKYSSPATCNQSVCNASLERSYSTSSASQTSLGSNFEKTFYSKNDNNVLDDNDITSEGDCNALNSPPITNSSPESRDSSSPQTSLELPSKDAFCSKQNINTLCKNDISNKGDFNALNLTPNDNASPESNDSVSSASLSKPPFCSIS